MAIYLLSQLAAGSTLSFNPASDVLHVDDPAWGAAQLWLSPNGNGYTYYFSSPSKGSIALTSPVAWQPASGHFTFADGSRFLVATGINASLAGTSQGDLLSGEKVADTTLSGGAGNDSYVVDSAGDRVVEAADGGRDTVRSSISYTLGAHVENLMLTGSLNSGAYGNVLDNFLLGNSGSNVLTGGAGNDILQGGGGADLLLGGTGNDVYILETDPLRPGMLDTVAEGEGAGIDTVRSSASYTLGAHLEHLTLIGPAGLSGTGNALHNQLTGSGGYDTLRGLAGNDWLDGGSGADSLAGGSGNDTYVIDHSGDLVVEESGIDTVRSSVSYTLGAGLEKLVLTGTASINGTGNALTNRLTGNAGFNLLDGGAGADTMSGGAGFDRYVVDDSRDVVIEEANAGYDTVQSSISYTLGSNVENLSLTGSLDLSGSGNALHNWIVGNAGSNVLDGGEGRDTLEGGAGADILVGGTGSDHYVVDDAEDIVAEGEGDGNDSVDSYVSRTIDANIERLSLKGIAQLKATGDERDNWLDASDQGRSLLEGGAGNDRLQLGRDDNDTLAGGSEDDLYVVLGGSAVNSSFVEKAGEGNDTVNIHGGHTLAANFENLEFSSGKGVGNELDNFIHSRDGNNTLEGGGGNDGLLGSYGDTSHDSLDGGSGEDTLAGGLGFDTLTGGTGNDVFVLAGGMGADKITDFLGGTDKLRIAGMYGVGRVGDGDDSVEGATKIAGPGGFGVGAELVIVTPDIGEGFSASSAAAALGSATSAYAVNDLRVFAVNDGSDSAVYLFKSSGSDALISADELTLLATLEGVTSTAASNYVFGSEMLSPGFWV